MWLLAHRSLFITLLLSTCIARLALAQSCNPPAIFTSTETTDTSVHLFWLTFSDPEIGFELTLVPEGQGPDSGDIVFLSPDKRMYTEQDLEPNTAYRAFIRILCLSDTSRWINHTFLTDIRNQYDCLTKRPIPDDGCDNAYLDISIHVPPSDSGSLGEDVTLTAANVIVRHPYPADLRMELINPRGISATLVEHHGTIFDNFGEPGDSTCALRTEFRSDACESIYDATPPFIGEFQPDMSLDILNDGGSPAGEWILRICDRAPDDVGELQHVSLDFEYGTCSNPPLFELLRQPDKTANFYHPPINADSLRFGYREGPGAPESPFDSTFVWTDLDPTDSSTEITGFEFQTLYEFYSYIYCDGQWIGPSCSSELNTFCGEISEYERWQNQDTCEADCNNSCALQSSIWRIPSISANWTIRRGEGPYSFTGPDAGPFARSDVPYLVSSGQNLNCDDKWNQLRSVCLEKTGSNCGFGFYYHQFGAQVGDFMLLVSENEWATHDTVYFGEASQESVWQYANIDLEDLPEGPFQLEFRVQNPMGPFSEIAIGDIFFSGIAPIPISDQITFVDSDRDGYGNPDRAVFYCGSVLPDSLSLFGSDCDDADSEINPSAEDQLCSGRDENCDGFENIGMADPFVIDSVDLFPASCPNSGDGSINLHVSGGIKPYQVLWNTGDTTLHLDSLSPGMYSVILADSVACQSIEKDFLLQAVNPVQFSFLILQRPNCLMPNSGEVEVLLTGGTPPYEVEWSNGVQSEVNDSMSAGAFYVTVTDANNCVYVSEEQQLSASDAFAINIRETSPIQCPEGDNGQFIAQVQGGVPPFSYYWNTGDTVRELQNVSSGWYQVSVEDSTQCVVTSDSVFVSSPSPMTLGDVQIRPQRCVGSDDGMISISVNGGTPPYSYEWNTPEGETRNQKNLDNLVPGLYFLTITDYNGCQFTPDALEVDSAIGFEVVDVIIDSSSCPTSPDGEIVIQLEGNTPALAINWSDNGANSLLRNDLRPGFYNLTITNSLECKRKLGPFEIPAGHEKLDIDVQALDTIECFSDTPQYIQASLQEGQFPIEYHWNTGRQVVRQKLSDSLQVLSSGSYKVTVTDGYGCVGESPEISIVGRAPIQIDSLGIFPPNCPTYENGQIFVRAQSPVSPVRYFWSTGRNGNQLNDLSSGSYGLTVEDESSCIPLTLDIELPGPVPFRIDVDTILESDSVCFNVNISGGNLPYTVFLNGSEGSDSPICFSREGEAVNLSVEDANGCVIDTLIWDFFTSSTELLPSEWKVYAYPNPATDRFMIESNSIYPVSYSLHDLTGKPMKTGITNSSDQEIDVSMFSAGIYVLKVKGHDGHVGVFRLIIQ